MNRRKLKTLSIPAIRRFREAVEKGDIGGFLIESGEKVCAGSVRVRYALKKRPWVVTIEVRKVYDNRH